MFQHICKVMAVGLAVGLTVSPMFISYGLAETYNVYMRNAKSDDPQTINVFEPPVLKIKKGDTVVFIPVDKGHNTASKKGMIPDGVKRWNSKLDVEFSITFEKDGTYGYVCVPHVQMGMVGLILVGDHTVNYDEARKVRQVGRARKVFTRLFEQVDAGDF